MKHNGTSTVLKLAHSPHKSATNPKEKFYGTGFQGKSRKYPYTGLPYSFISLRATQSQVNAKKENQKDVGANINNTE